MQLIIHYLEQHIDIEAILYETLYRILRAPLKSMLNPLELGYGSILSIQSNILDG